MRPTHITFEQARLLCKIGFTVGTRNSYNELGNLILPYYGDKYVNGNSNGDSLFEAPEQHQVVEWLRINHNIELSVQVNFYNRKSKLGYFYTIDKFDSNNIHDGKDYDKEQINLIGDKKGFNTPQEAYSAAFDYILNNLI